MDEFNEVETVDQDQEGPGLAEMLEEYESEQEQAAAEAARPDPAAQEKARALAEKINGGFLWAVNRTQCPHVPLDQLIDPNQGAEAFTPLAEKFGGEVPPWMVQFEPYIKAGIYMGSVIITARQAEAQALEMLEQKKLENSGAADGEERES